MPKRGNLKTDFSDCVDVTKRKKRRRKVVENNTPSTSIDESVDKHEDQDERQDSTKKVKRNSKFIQQVRKRLKKWHDETGTPACVVFLRGGNVTCEGPDYLKEGFGKNPKVQKAFVKAVLENDENTGGSFPVTLPTNPRMCKVSDLRIIVCSCVKIGKEGYTPPNWGNNEYRPCWWPQEIPFLSPSTGQSKISRSQLISIVESYRSFYQSAGDLHNVTGGNAEGTHCSNSDTEPEDENIGVPFSHTRSFPVTLPTDPRMCRVDDLRKIVSSCVKFKREGYTAPNWGKNEYRPCWWPQEIPFRCPADTKSKISKSQLITLVESYRSFYQSAGDPHNATGDDGDGSSNSEPGDENTGGQQTYTRSLPVTLPTNPKKCKIGDLRSIVSSCVKNGKEGYTVPNWGKNEYRPCWWPQEIPFLSPCTGKSKISKSQLISILESYRSFYQIASDPHDALGDDGNGSSNSDIEPGGNTGCNSNSGSNGGCFIPMGGLNDSNESENTAEGGQIEIVESSIAADHGGYCSVINGNTRCDSDSGGNSVCVLSTSEINNTAASDDRADGGQIEIDESSIAADNISGNTGCDSNGGGNSVCVLSTSKLNDPNASDNSAQDGHTENVESSIEADHEGNSIGISGNTGCDSNIIALATAAINASGLTGTTTSDGSAEGGHSQNVESQALGYQIILVPIAGVMGTPL